MKDDTREHYTEREARALVGKTFESLVEFSGVPQGARGKVVDADNAGLGHWDVVIEWDTRRPAPKARALEIEGEHALFVQTGKPLRDWFTKDEMARFMREAVTQ